MGNGIKELFEERPTDREGMAGYVTQGFVKLSRLLLYRSPLQ